MGALSRIPCSFAHFFPPSAGGFFNQHPVCFSVRGLARGAGRARCGRLRHRKLWTCGAGWIIAFFAGFVRTSRFWLPLIRSGCPAVWYIVSPRQRRALEEIAGFLGPVGLGNAGRIRGIRDRGPVAVRAARLRPAACLVSAGLGGWPGFAAGLPRGRNDAKASHHFDPELIDDADDLRDATGLWASV